jgi:hypothetical protein
MLASPVIESYSPRVLQSGTTNVLVFRGREMESVRGIWTSFGFTSRVAHVSEKEARLEVALPQNAPGGLMMLALVASNGVSASQPLFVDGLVPAVESKTNQQRSSAQAVQVGSVIEGTARELGYDWFRLPLRKGQRASVEVVAARMGSRLDSVLRVVDADGRELAAVDDIPGLRADGYLRFVAPAAGDYFIELRDVNYGGGNEHFYLLRVGDFECATAAFPPAMARGSGQKPLLVGSSGTLKSSRLAASTKEFGVVEAPGTAGSAFGTVLWSEHEEFVESRKKRVRLRVPCGVSGRFEQPGERDAFEFAAKKGERVEFAAASRSLGSPCDVLLKIETADGKSLAMSNPTGVDEGIVSFRAASNGVFRLVVEEMSGLSGPNALYRVVGRPAAGTLTTETERVEAAPGGTFELKVATSRREFKGPVTLRVVGLEGCTLTNNVLGEGKTNLTLKVTLPPTWSPATARVFAVEGYAERDGQSVIVRASTAPALRRRFPAWLHVPPHLEGSILLGVTAK